MTMWGRGEEETLLPPLSVSLPQGARGLINGVEITRERRGIPPGRYIRSLKALSVRLCGVGSLRVLAITLKSR